MVDPKKLHRTAQELRTYAQQVRTNKEVLPHATSHEDSELFDKAAKELDEAADALKQTQ